MHKPGASIAFLAVVVLTVVDQAWPQTRPNGVRSAQTLPGRRFANQLWRRRTSGAGCRSPGLLPQPMRHSRSHR